MAAVASSLLSLQRNDRS